jgi:hypothetical protein
MADLTALDKIKRELEEQFPGWHIWYLPRVNGPTRWCAAMAAYQQRQPGASRRRDPQRTREAAGWPALASIEDYAVTAPGSPRALFSKLNR